MHFKEFTHPDDCAKDLELFHQLVQGECSNYQMEKRFIRKDGLELWARLSVARAGETTSHNNFAVGMVENMTVQRQLQSQFIEAQKMEVIGQLAGGVAHDFNNLLAVIMGYSDLTIQKFPDNEEIRTPLETIRATAERAAGLTRQLLIFSRKQKVQPTVLDLNIVMHDLEKMLRRLIDENIEMKFVAGKAIGRIKADGGHVGQVLMNLVVNARDAMPNGGMITLTTSNVTLDENYAHAHTGALPGDYVMLSVSDTGTGMTDEVKAHLFEAFFTTKPKGKGTGLVWRLARPLSNNPAVISVLRARLAKARPSRFIFRESICRWIRRPAWSDRDRCPAGRKPCWWWRMNPACVIWRVMFWKPKATACCVRPMARKAFAQHGNPKGSP